MKIGNHIFQEVDKNTLTNQSRVNHNFHYFRCKNCDLVIFKGEYENKYYVSMVSIRRTSCGDPESIDCNDFLIRGIIE